MRPARWICLLVLCVVPWVGAQHQLTTTTDATDCASQWLPDLVLDNVIQDAMMQQHWSPAWAQQVSCEYRKLWRLRQRFPDWAEPLPLPIDQLWCHHIVRTVQHARDCQRELGDYFQRTSTHGAYDSETFERVRAAYQHVFDENPPVPVWGQSWFGLPGNGTERTANGRTDVVDAYANPFASFVLVAMVTLTCACVICARIAWVKQRAARYEPIPIVEDLEE